MKTALIERMKKVFAELTGKNRFVREKKLAERYPQGSKFNKGETAI